MVIVWTLVFRPPLSEMVVDIIARRLAASDGSSQEGLAVVLCFSSLLRCFSLGRGLSIVLLLHLAVPDPPSRPD